MLAVKVRSWSLGLDMVDIIVFQLYQRKWTSNFYLERRRVSIYSGTYDQVKKSSKFAYQFQWSRLYL